MEYKDSEIKRRTLADEYESLKQDRQPYLSKAKEACKYTIPSLIADCDTKKNNRKIVKIIETPNQSVGADGVNNLSAKITTTMLPPNQTFFKFSMDKITIANQATVEGADKSKFEQDVNKGLSIIEKALLDYQEQSGDRVCVGEAIKHQLIAGNVFLVHDPKDGLRYYPLDRFVVKRDYCGNVIKAITEETVNFYALPKKIQDEVMMKILQKRVKKNDTSDLRLEDEELTLYTGFKREDKFWTVTQEVEGIKLDTDGKYPIEICPFMALRYTAIDGESYGRGLIEEYIGDISYLDTLSLAIKQASLAGSKLVMLVNPNGLTKIKHLSEAKNGEISDPLENLKEELRIAQNELKKLQEQPKAAEKLPDITIKIDKNAANPYATLRSEIEHARDIAKGEVPDQNVKHFSRYEGLNEGEVASSYVYKKSKGKASKMRTDSSITENQPLQNVMKDGQTPSDDVKLDARIQTTMRYNHVIARQKIEAISVLNSYN